jgi:hypothetical protein
VSFGGEGWERRVFSGFCSFDGHFRVDGSVELIVCSGRAVSQSIKDKNQCRRPKTDAENNQ